MELCAKGKGSDSAPAKRPFHVRHQQSKITNELDKSNKNSESGLAEKRAELDKKLKATFESIFEKYSKDFNGIGDEIDIATGEIVIDNGHLHRMQSKGNDDVWNYTPNQKKKIDDKALEDSAFPPEICSIICEEDDEEQDLRGNPVFKEEGASESECDCDCYEDDLILRGFVQANRFLKLPSKDTSSVRLDTFQRDSTLNSLSSHTENISEVNKNTNKESFCTKPKILDRAYNHIVHEDEIELAWQLPKLLPSQQDLNRKPIERTETEKLFTIHANLSFNSKSVEYWGLERQARQFKLESHNYSYFSNYSPGYSNEKTETNISSYLKAISQDSSTCSWETQFFRGEENPPNLATKEILSSGIDSNDTKNSMAKHWSSSCEQEEILKNAEFISIVKHEDSQIPDISINSQKIYGTKSDSLVKDNDLIFHDVGSSSNSISTTTSISDDTSKLNVLLNRSNTYKIHDNSTLSSNSFNKNFSQKKFIKTVEESERYSNSVLNNQATVMAESSRSPSEKSLLCLEKYDPRNSHSPIHIEKNTSDKSSGKSTMVPKQKFNQPIINMEINQNKAENFSILKPIFIKKTNIMSPAHLHTTKPSLVSTPIQANDSLNSSKPKHVNLVPRTPNRNFSLGAKTSLSKSLWRKALRDSPKWSPKSEEFDELSLDQPSRIQNPNLKICDKNENLERSPRFLSVVKKKKKRLFSNLEDENDEDELSINFKKSFPSKRESI